MKTIFDFGMCDAADTVYFLEEGFKVVAVEANPALVQNVNSVIGHYIESGQLQIINAAISTNNNPVELTICGDDVGSSSIYEYRLTARLPLGKFTVPGVTTQEIMDRFGVPYYLKVDLEGADRLAVLDLSAAQRPEYLSFEIGDDFEELLAHVSLIGYSRFKIINQTSFREVENQSSLKDRVTLKIIRCLGYTEPRSVRRKGRYFELGRSSGPAPWCSDGRWCDQESVLRKWIKVRASRTANWWYDLHAA
jgi:FkbM family methyltransferase